MAAEVQPQLPEPDEQQPQRLYRPSQQKANDDASIPRSLKNLFIPDNTRCQRCGERVYQVEKLGPVNEVIFHRQCFKCYTCNKHLTLRTYFTNPVELRDKHVYCRVHCPKYTGAGLDSEALGIKAAMASKGAGMNKYNDQVRLASGTPHFGADALHINHPVAAQYQYQRKYKQGLDKHHFPPFLVITQEKIYQAQVELEQQHKAEEDRLMNEYQLTKQQETEKIKKEVDQEWEVRLKELTAQFDQDLTKRGTKRDLKAMTVRYEQEKEELKKNMTVRFKQKKDAATVKLKQKAQEDTSQLVQKHSAQMLVLLKTKQEEIKNELQSNGQSEESDSLETALAAITLPTELPDPHPPKCRKRDLYTDPSVFKELDEDVFKVAEDEQSTFTDLVRQLTEHCISDLEKARAIFRWITVKDLNVLEFSEDDINQDTPMGLLRGIKFGTETYHTLFMRLCSYAGLACVEIKGHSKSVGYEPGMKIREDTFQNTWNAVLIDGDWWPVQCNWGARHLVLNKDPKDKDQEIKTKKQDKIRYQYDEHYFLTDPDEFIQEFWAQEPEWQLLEKDVTLEEFEAMPFVRSVFFHYGLEFEQMMKAVLVTDNKGGTEVKIRVPEEYAKDLVFHYQIRFADRERRHETEFRGAKLERFVFHSLVDYYALFSVHVPTAAAYFLEIFANKIDESNKIGNDPNATMMPFRLKCACKFKIVCDELVGKMHPLPNCASGEWGPSKGHRHFGITAITHSTGVVNVDNEAEIRFQLPRTLHFLCKLRMNGVEDHLLERYVSHTAHDGLLTIRVTPPQPGQYGLDIYARPEDAVDNHTLAHACKYLLNVTQVINPSTLTISKVEPSSKMPKDKWGAAPAFNELGLRLISHPEPTIDTSEHQTVIEIGLSEPLKMSYHFLRQPDEDCKEKVTMRDKGDRVRFSVSTNKPGSYLLAIYARKKKNADSNMINVYNYLLRYTPGGNDKENSLKKKSKFFKK
ncbi:hypothetical protein LSH36_211g04058 [Paralvinella palmiformis]|uniref:LIM zinc-binding domain-containing protein n=1 Tax=Paralvinella palmiformis TaxID=53620 RepID=A0AAD9JQ27_9ANNE|nr:hypothetical protein LSH36_211g04058 [Paralvinella palmiformis]